MMVNAYNFVYGTYPVCFISDPLNIAAIQNKNRVKPVYRVHGMYNILGAGEESIHIRCLVLIINDGFFAHATQCVIYGQLRPQGITIRSHVGRDEKGGAGMYNL